MHGALSSVADRDVVENVVVFVSDALRYDFLPECVRRRGVTAKAIAPSTFTASALPSLLTGQYPGTHGVWMFEDQLPERPPLLTPRGRTVGFDAETVWTELPSGEKPPLQIHQLDAERKLAELSPPFTHVVHDIGPHAPYGFDNDVFESTAEFFAQYENRRPQLVDLYRRDASRSAERFLDVYSQLQSRDLLADTLVVFTSDHGQALGEPRNGGRFGHGHPLCPETVTVPVVFLGAGLPEGEHLSTLLSGADVAPTALGALGERPSGLDGVDVWHSPPPDGRRLRSDVFQHLSRDVLGHTVDLSVYAGTSLWNESGGHVFHHESAAQRLFAIAYDNLFRGYSPAWRRNATLGATVRLAALALSSHVTYGSPDFSAETARVETPESFDLDAGGAQVTLSTDQEARLRNLGYLE